MQKRIFIFLLIVVSAGTLFTNSSSGQSVSEKPVSGDTSFNAFLIKWQKAYNAFINGDSQPWKMICSQTDDASIFGGFGGFEKGWANVSPRYDWAASQFKNCNAKLEIEYVNVILNDNLANLVLIERAYTMTGTAKQPLHTLRSTQIFRKENGEWKLLHRHADYQMGKKVQVTDTK
jgi:ketosteroid isomerase-like protein